jgi:predicted nucleic acid-binding protein
VTRVLLDTDVILDVLLDRPQFVDQAGALWEAHEQGKIEGHISAITPVNVFYIARKLKDAETARLAVSRLIGTFRVCTVNHAVLRQATQLLLSDYEDAVQLASAMTWQLDAIITRNLGDYQQSPLPVFSPADFLTKLANG